MCIRDRRFRRFWWVLRFLFFSVVFEFFFFLERLILFPSVRVRYLLYNKRTR